MRPEFSSSDDTAPISLVRRSLPSANSLRPMGIDVKPSDRPLSDVDLAARRERLQRIVIGALAGCGLILLAAAGAQVARASASASPPQAGAAPAHLTGPAAEQSSPEVAETPEPKAAASPAPTPADVPTIGTLRLRWPAVPGHVWLDGEKVTSSSAVVACGTHELRVGAKGRARTVAIPCGGELRVAR
jgi:hypothetical protein